MISRSICKQGWHAGKQGMRRAGTPCSPGPHQCWGLCDLCGPTVRHLPPGKQNHAPHHACTRLVLDQSDAATRSHLDEAGLKDVEQDLGRHDQHIVLCKLLGPRGSSPEVGPHLAVVAAHREPGLLLEHTCLLLMHWLGQTSTDEVFYAASLADLIGG